MKLTKEEFSTLKELNTEYGKLRNNLADVEIQRIGLAEDVKSLRLRIQSHELNIIEKYGVDSVINMETGDVKNKKKNG
jgi:hypothetical protein|tara:strand:+ start:1570 stop:1803 length:234 start_codon:yes stop_codon:yes gene_type:complete